ncbi:MAG: dihydrodipicolinate synthase family protein [Chloroflexota bacterium]|nr:dihydrodipicolinate synthase family protein [Chloroflexota bacterium]
MKKLRGVIPPMVTPFDEDGALDEKNLVKLVEFLSDKVDGLFICGSYGSGPLMTLEERKKVAEIVKKTASSNVTIVAHTGTATTKDTIELTKHAMDIGCDAASAVGPFYYAYGDYDLIRYYETILKEVDDFPFYVYHNPKFQGYSTSFNAIRTLKDLGLAGVKDATFDIQTYSAYASELVDDNFDVALGTEALWVSAHALGCQAFIPGIGNVLPELCHTMWQQSMDGKRAESLESQFKINKIRQIMYLARSTQLAVYAIAEIRGIIKAYPRSPFIEATSEEKGRIREELDKLGVL